MAATLVYFRVETNKNQVEANLSSLEIENDLLHIPALT